jgi:hypothetical protein
MASTEFELLGELEDEFEGDAMELEPFFSRRGGSAQRYSNKGWGAHEFEVDIPKTIHRLDCPAGCPGGLTEAQCADVVRRAINVAIDLAQNAASKVEKATVFGPRDLDAQKTAHAFNTFFGHDPWTELTFDGKKERSGVSIAKRFRAVARELGSEGKRRVIFRCVAAMSLAGSTAGDATHPARCGVGVVAFWDPPLPNAVHLCPLFWNSPEAARGGTILHEMLHMLYDRGPEGLFSDTGRRANAHCYKAFALKVRGYARDEAATCMCWELGDTLTNLNECKRRLGLPPTPATP